MRSPDVGSTPRENTRAAAARTTAHRPPLTLPFNRTVGGPVTVGYGDYGGFGGYQFVEDAPVLLADQRNVTRYVTHDVVACWPKSKMQTASSIIR